jgi:hypothetical protein
MKADPPPANPMITTSSVLKILTMPLAEVLFFKKAIKGVVKFLLIIIIIISRHINICRINYNYLYFINY